MPIPIVELELQRTWLALPRRRPWFVYDESAGLFETRDPVVSALVDHHCDTEDGDLVEWLAAVLDHPEGLVIRVQGPVGTVTYGLDRASWQ